MTEFREGWNAPSPVGRVLILGYYDGATDGVLQLNGGRVYRFDLLDEARNADGLDEREYELRPLPADALDRLVRAIGEYITPTWPVWLPVWRFPSPETEQAVRRQVDAVLEAAATPAWHIVTNDTVEFATLTARPLVRAAV